MLQSTEHCRYYTGDKFYLNAIPTLCCLVLLLGVGGYITWVHFHPPGPAYQARQPDMMIFDRERGNRAKMASMYEFSFITFSLSGLKVCYCYSID